MGIVSFFRNPPKENKHGLLLTPPQKAFNLWVQCTWFLPEQVSSPKIPGLRDQQCSCICKFLFLWFVHRKLPQMFAKAPRPFINNACPIGGHLTCWAFDTDCQTLRSQTDYSEKALPGFITPPLFADCHLSCQPFCRGFVDAHRNRSDFIHQGVSGQGVSHQLARPAYAPETIRN